MTEEEEGVSALFLEMVDSFNRESERIFKQFDEIKSKYSEGVDIRADLEAFKSKNPRIFTLIDDIYHKEVELTDKLDKGEVEQEKRAKLLEFKVRFADLADEIDFLVLEEIGVLK
ncbi:hypothetical protein CW713_07875 [Methanophagales archaeon]|nr:MAG: hypothetical protein CW713_07875 [Methanophagales archaeon]